MQSIRLGQGACCIAAVRRRSGGERSRGTRVRCVASGVVEDGEVLLSATKRQKVSMMSLGCPKNVVDGAALLRGGCDASQPSRRAASHTSTLIRPPRPRATGEVMLGDLFREGFEITVCARAERCGLPLRLRSLDNRQTSHEEADAIVVNTCAFIDEARLSFADP